MGAVLNVLQTTGSAVEIILRYLPIFLILFLVLALAGYLEDLNFKRIANSRIKEIDSLTQPKFKYFVRSFLFLLGYKELKLELVTEDSNEDESVEEEEQKDGADLLEKIKKEQEMKKKKESKKLKDIDVVVARDDVYFGVLVVKDLSPHASTVIEKLSSAVKEYNLNYGLLVTNARINLGEIQEATSRNIEVWDREKLIQNLLLLQGISDPKRKPLFFYFGDFWSWVLRG